MKIILILIILIAIFIFFRKKLNRGEKNNENEIAMIECYICNTFIDKKIAITNEKKNFCSIECLKKYKS